MLSIRTGLPLSRFKCGYFDYGDVFTFDPERAYRSAFALGNKMATYPSSSS
jgi:hypothetical protein